ncbi:MAG: DUF86 domain-containing protein [Clostridiales Family XIII bacterium]|jgi:uncharacterized protein with HEPN domain|nr:DUF86 domain-containing protein [Clostridiales Family XIII bacterium]
MKPNSRNVEILKRIIGYCNEISSTLEIVNHDYETMMSNFLYKNSLAMNVLQIGELVKNLTADFKQKHRDMPWGDIAGMRDIAAHGYGDFDFSVLWETVNEDIELLKSFCQKSIEELKA